ncbi:MAG TPA: citrate:proton symporter [Vicinamibacterales bacterium]|nr:citrate:proton symporter [Vicinamibacterales bacterium]
MAALALLGCATIGVFLFLITFTRTPVIAALVWTPLIAALAGGFAGQVGSFAVDGLKTVAPVAALMMFAVLYFGLMIDVGLFTPLIERLVSLVREDPIRLCLATAALPMLVAFDGDGATTFLVSITALLPVHRRLRMNPLILPSLVGLAAGVMNLLPWGGPTARAMSVLRAGVDQIFVPVLPAMGAGVLWVFFVAWRFGRVERRRLTNQISAPDEARMDAIAATTLAPSRTTPLFYFNAALTSLVLVLLLQGLFITWVTLPELPASLLFMTAFAIALPLNRRTADAQREQMAAHAGSAVLVVGMILAAGVFTGILNGTGMIKAMATLLASNTPSALSPWLAHIIAITSMPLSLVFTPDAYYFGVLPVFAEAAAAVGDDPFTVGRASILGQMTTGFPLSPLTASTFVLLGLSGVSLRDHQRFTFKWAFGTTLVMTIVASLTGAI